VKLREVMIIMISSGRPRPRCRMKDCIETFWNRRGHGGPLLSLKKRGLNNIYLSRTNAYHQLYHFAFKTFLIRRVGGMEFLA